ncbi:TlpA family protein disulfide reductase [Patiriisocius hiemis]|uniref:Thioredoxin family protein n=1 Tax=Patiriisocius hiemis TaxID=3075604 RepID=A0ABU2YFJ0_9FLAO|nr:thioredoxin family protein [Constantimarinum sp. W242]MDT0556532.1 thioredoxin family protein [Constantimarinum sp. W242]
MKNILLLSTMFLVFIACNQTNKSEKEDVIQEEESIESKETLNKEVPYEDEETVMLLGKINKEGLQKEPYSEWFKENYKAQVLDTLAIKKIENLLKDVSIKVFMGTWCEDSQREIPHLFKILDSIDFDVSKLEVIAMTDIKETPQNYEKDLNIEYVPTLLFYKEDKELGRYVELAQETLEKDMIAILSGEEYKHSYQE